MTDGLAWWGAITGTVATTLSLWNAWHSHRQTRPNVRVEPRFKGSLYDTSLETTLAVHVVNASPFDVTIARAAVASRGQDGKVVSELPLEGFHHGLPQTLAPRSSVDLSLTLRATLELAFERFDHVSVELSTGEVFRSPKRHRFAGKSLKEIQRLASGRGRVEERSAGPCWGQGAIDPSLLPGRSLAVPALMLLPGQQPIACSKLLTPALRRPSLPAASCSSCGSA